MQSYSHTLFFRYYELLHKLAVIHVPHLDHPVTTTARNRIVLIKLMERAALVLCNLELSWWQVFKINATQRVVGCVTRFNFDGCSLDPGEEPYSAC